MNYLRHAYLILAHNEPKILQTLVEMVDDERNDIYIHIDKKSNINHFLPLTTHYSNLTFTERINVNWGGWSVVAAELLLLLTARKKGRYGYYHLLSGVDLPLKSQNYIHSKLDSSPTLEYFEYSFDENNKINIAKNAEWRYLFEEYLKNPSYLKRKFCSFIRKSYLKIQTIFNLRKQYNIELAKASNWFSITEPCCDYILSKSRWLENSFKYTHVPDEIAIPSLIFNSNYYKNISSESIRKIDWDRGSPYTWQIEDYNDLISSNYLFARKFSSNDMIFIHMIKDMI